MLKLRDIHKSFGPVEVLRGVSIDVAEGEILGLVGENGAGKSTLMNILGGVLQPTKGEILVQDIPYEPKSTRDAAEKGIAFIHQELNLFPNLSVGENLFIHQLPRHERFKPLISNERISRESEKLLAEVGLEVSPSKPVSALTNAQQQLVEIAKALHGSPAVIIFDEPTTALSRHEAERLFELIQRLKSRKITMVYISHNIEDVLKLSDKIAVLRDGQLIDLDLSNKFNKEDLVAKMIGRELKNYFPQREKRVPGEVQLKVEGLSSPDFSNISFEVRSREILGFYGLVGAGRSELARAIMGLDHVTKGSIFWQNALIRKPSPALWIRKGVILLTEDRGEDGLLPTKGIRENVQLASLPQYTNAFKWLDYPSIIEKVNQLVKSTRLKFNDLENQEVISLSGGNQQKVILTKWLMTNPQLLILDEPTKGIDIGAKQEIYQLINNLVDQGSCVIMISSEIEELLGMCDRILVMNRGAIKAAFDESSFDRQAILREALHVTEVKEKG